MATVTHLGRPVVSLLSTLIFFFIYPQQQLGLSTSSPSECVCPGDTLTYECTVTVGIKTVWTGSAFDCPNSGNQILLLHRFRGNVIYGGTCNNEAIVARILSVDGDNYTSQLDVPFTIETAGKTIACLSDNGTDSVALFSSLAPTTGLFSTSNKLWISNADISPSKHLTFSWSPVATDCPAINYNILASNCGSCPTTTNQTTVTCIETPTDDGSVCTFVVQIVVHSCESFAANLSDPIRVNTDILYHRENLRMCKVDTNRGYIISTGFLATALIIGIAVSVSLTVILIISKAKIKALKLQLTSRDGRNTQPMYEDIVGPSPPVSRLNTQDNIAYGHI